MRSQDSITLRDINVLLTKCKGGTGRISIQRLNNADRAQRSMYRYHRGPIFTKHHLLSNLVSRRVIHCSTKSSKKCYDNMTATLFLTGNKAFWLVGLSLNRSEIWQDKCTTVFKTHMTSERFFIAIIVTSSFSPLMMNSENSKAVPTLRRIGGRGLPGV